MTQISEHPAATDDRGRLAAEIETEMAAVVAKLEQWRTLGGTGGAPVGLGSRPAIVVIDLARFWTEPQYEAYSAGSAGAIEQVNRLIAAARPANVPVIFTTQAYQSPAMLVSATGMSRKFPGSVALREGSVPAELHPDLALGPDDHVLVKTQSSAFAHTHLASMLHFAGIDTVIVTGVVTSGCVRATAADALAHGFRLAVVPECVSDVTPGATTWTLFDISTKIGDVLPLVDAIEYLELL